MQHVIIGAGPAGVVAAEAIRTFDVSSTVTLVGDEPERPYSRMAIPYYLVGQIAEEGTHLRKGADHFASQGIDIRHGRVVQVDTAADAVVLDSKSHRVAATLVQGRFSYIAGDIANRLLA